MGENTTKVISARVPMATYAQLLALAGEMKMSTADFVLLKLFAPADPSVESLRHANQQIQQLTSQVSTLTITNGKLATNRQQWVDTAECLQIDFDMLREERDQVLGQLKQVSQESDQLQSQVTTLTQQLQAAQTQILAAQQRLQDLRQALAQEHNNSKSRDMMPDQYWAIIEQFVPKKI
jgi:chromosome segregation ATPase